MAQIPAQVLELIAKFDAQSDLYQSPTYNETQLRIDFVNPMFKALGWDIDNTKGYAEAFREVVHEDAVRIGGTVKSPDYSFRIGGRRIFFLEAKKPAINIKDDVDPAYQLRRYAWTAKLPISILTNFEEFAVYDCHPKPKYLDKASNARLLYFTYKEYAERWDEIVTIFSPQAIQQGAFDRYVKSHKKRGTQEFDDSFLEELEDWRKRLALNLALRNPNLDDPGLNFATQRIIDRVIFLRMCEDRGIEPPFQLQALLAGDNTYARLRSLFTKADQRYNSGLFHFRKEKGRHELPDECTPSLEIDDAALKHILQRLYYPDSPYVFKEVAADILGSVYERFLGNVIHLTAGHHAKIEPKPEVRKAGGVYYTPQYIVDYIVQNTVGKLLEDKTPASAAKLRILDPACGSGSFLLGAYQYLLDWHQQWYLTNDSGKWSKGRNPTLRPGPAGELVLSIRERKRILTDNICGVDIDPQAVEVTKLSLLLKCLEGESAQSINDLLLFHERALPDLGDNIKCGNSLISTEICASEEWQKLCPEQQSRVRPFAWQEEFADVFQSGGFHAVIGNPPYGASLEAGTTAYLKSHFVCQNYQLDSYLLFVEQAIRGLLRTTGLFGMIFPNPWLTNLLQTNTRRFVVENSRIVDIVHFEFPVFRGVTVDTQVVVLEKERPDGWSPTVVVAPDLDAFVRPEQASRLRVFTHKQDQWRQLQGGVINIFLSPQAHRLALTCRNAGVPLHTLFDINVGIKPYQKGKGTPQQTAKIVESRPFDSDRKAGAAYRRYLRGADIRRYAIAPLEPRFLKYGPWLAEPRPAANFDAPEKIVMRQTGDGLVAAMDDKQFLCLNNMHVLVPRSGAMTLPYVLGILNSSLLNWFYRTLNPEVGEALAEVKKANVAVLPIRPVDFAIEADKVAHDRLVTRVTQMVALQQSLATAQSPTDKESLQRQIDATDSQIDRLVYDLYGLSADEIGIVEQPAPNQ